LSADTNINKKKVIAIVGMAGSGKSEVARFLESDGYHKVRFGNITDEEVKKRGLPLNEENERLVRQELRREQGMAAYALLNIPKINKFLESSNVVVDGLYSWAEYQLMKQQYGDKFVVLAVWSSPTTRYRRLTKRIIRPLKLEEATSRDKAEIENSAKGGPIAMADYTIINESSLEKLIQETRRILTELK
jgi:dephospho-CoA kinase